MAASGTGPGPVPDGEGGAAGPGARSGVSSPGSASVPSGVRVSAVRWAVGGCGLVLIGIGGWLLAEQSRPWDVVLWLGGALVLHDGLIAPLVLGVGLLVAGVPARPVVRGALVTAGALVLVTLPLLLRPGAPPNPSALPLPYAGNLLLVLAGVAGGAALVVLVKALWRRRASGRGAGAGEGPGADGGRG
ncbi:hypothetical protein [Streptomyces sp. NPDC097619]|uniref:hypothetical protein n=1 Tax=Streptomyces sp. NPDC097619 TaxID=3157228 RepID=UPI0033206483